MILHLKLKNLLNSKLKFEKEAPKQQEGRNLSFQKNNNETTNFQYKKPTIASNNDKPKQNNFDKKSQNDKPSLNNRNFFDKEKERKHQLLIEI